MRIVRAGSQPVLQAMYRLIPLIRLHERLVTAALFASEDCTSDTPLIWESDRDPHDRKPARAMTSGMSLAG